MLRHRSSLCGVLGGLLLLSSIIAAADDIYVDSPAALSDFGEDYDCQPCHRDCPLPCPPSPPYRPPGEAAVVRDMDLLQAIDPPQGTPLGQLTSITNLSGNDTVSYLKGLDGYPAFLLKPSANIHKPAMAHIPRLPRDFAILLTIIPSDELGGFLFAVVNPLDTIVQLGLSLSAGPAGKPTSDITLYYTDYRTQETSQVLVKFNVPSFVRQWTSITLKVQGNTVTLYMDCLEFAAVDVSDIHRPEELTFELGSWLFIGKGGDRVGKSFGGGIQQLTVTYDVDKAASQCDDDDADPYQEFSGSSESNFPVGPGGYPEVLKGEKGDPGKLGLKGERGDQGPPGEIQFISPPPMTPPPPPPPPSRGQKGDSGAPGLQGRPGIPAPPLPGPKGEPGESIVGLPGLPGIEGIDGLPGPPGPPGIPASRADGGSESIVVKGEQGLQGQKGQTGMLGPPGPPGQPGVPGSPGLLDENEYIGSGELPTVFPGDSSPGYPGEKGQSGALGPMGPQGLPGQPGAPGESGLPGLEGSAGVPGYPGPRGEKGDTGSPGIGVPGLAGDVGSTGLPGPPGRTLTVKGVDITGPSGPPGAKGERGQPGSVEACGTGSGGCGDGAGLIGPRGRPGPVGPHGPSGIMGEIGLPGFPGRAGARGLPGIAIKGQKGEPTGRGGQTHPPDQPQVPGTPGRPGRPGTPGPPGQCDRCVPDGPPDTTSHGVPGLPGPPGVPGRDGRCSSECGGLPDPPGRQPGAGAPVPGDTEEEGQGVFTPAAGAVTFRSREELLRVSQHIPYGTLTFLMDTEQLLVRVRSGYREIQSAGMILDREFEHVTEPTTRLPDIIAPPQDTGVVAGPMLHLVAANKPYMGNINGISGADYICYKEARAAKLPGTYRAFLSSRVQDLVSIVHRKQDRTLPVVNLRDQVLFSSWNDIFNGAGAYFNDNVPIYSFDGKDVLYDPTWPQKIIWHGATSRGKRNEESYCHAWSTDSSTDTGIASSLLKNMILDNQEFSCSNGFILLCVENSYRSYRK